jgi:hypothetical protein
VPVPSPVTLAEDVCPQLVDRQGNAVLAGVSNAEVEQVPVFCEAGLNIDHAKRGSQLVAHAPLVVLLAGACS